MLEFEYFYHLCPFSTYIHQKNFYVFLLCVRSIHRVFVVS